MLRKQIINPQRTTPNATTGEIDIAAVATVQVTSEAPDHPIAAPGIQLQSRRNGLRAGEVDSLGPRSDPSTARDQAGQGRQTEPGDPHVAGPVLRGILRTAHTDNFTPRYTVATPLRCVP